MANNFRDSGRLENIYSGDPADDSVHPADHTVTEPEPMPETETIDDLMRRSVIALAVDDACRPLRARVYERDLQISELLGFWHATIDALRLRDERAADATMKLLDRFRAKYGING